MARSVNWREKALEHYDAAVAFEARAARETGPHSDRERDFCIERAKVHAQLAVATAQMEANAIAAHRDWKETRQ